MPRRAVNLRLTDDEYQALARAADLQELAPTSFALAATLSAILHRTTGGSGLTETYAANTTYLLTVAADALASRGEQDLADDCRKASILLSSAIHQDRADHDVANAPWRWRGRHGIDWEVVHRPATGSVLGDETRFPRIDWTKYWSAGERQLPTAGGHVRPGAVTEAQ